MKKFWIKVIPWQKELITAALESGADAVWIEKGFNEQVKQLGKINTIAEDGDIKIDKDVIYLKIQSKEDEEKALQMSKSKTVILSTPDWSIIPLENLIAQTKGLIAEVNSFSQAKTALQILEKGVDGILLNTTNLNEIKKTASLVKNISENLNLSEAKITNAKVLGMGDRVCIDTCSKMKLGEGMLIGNSSSAMFLVHSETIENPYVETRPFRVNAGGLHAYTLLPEGKTKYLSEIKSGDEVLIVNSKGDTQVAIVGRAKIERRPMMLVEAEVEGKKVSLILQNAETVNLTESNGSPISVVSLKKGAPILVYTENTGRHFGIKIEETIEEK
ncbi:MAG: 3-dehydroquinate synthase II [Candidatus Omnitrophica bacterium]|nr:3-dehydroquinate synthase II [Candidatus Omnitrophota bacterium]